ncbi:methyltransferase domain-containing protein [Streptomyces sp. NPDC058746]|uniref:methyltransferase domain-containing protein n=1 Tax=Streptomyces sp. NPDC058746 TaxID=3346622 RepID=UPI00368A8478
MRSLGAATVRVLAGRAEEIPLPEAAFDAAVAAWVLHYTDGPDTAVAELARTVDGHRHRPARHQRRLHRRPRLHPPARPPPRSPGRTGVRQCRTGAVLPRPAPRRPPPAPDDGHLPDHRTPHGPPTGR